MSHPRRIKRPAKNIRPQPASKKRKTQIKSVHPTIAAWFNAGQISLRYAHMIQDLRRLYIVGPTNFDHILHSSHLRPHTIGVHAQNILLGEETAGALIRAVNRAQEPTVPNGKIDYILNLKKGFFGDSLERLRKEYEGIMPDILWFKIIKLRAERTASKQTQKTVIQLLEQRHELVHELWDVYRNPEHKRPARAVWQALDTLKREMQQLAAYL